MYALGELNCFFFVSLRVYFLTKKLFVMKKLFFLVAFLTFLLAFTPLDSKEEEAPETSDLLILIDDSGLYQIDDGSDCITVMVVYEDGSFDIYGPDGGC